jgi:tetratricopeptide (TPR) repeat protein
LSEKFLSKSHLIIVWWAAIICLTGVGLWATLYIHPQTEKSIKAQLATNKLVAASLTKGLSLMYSGKVRESIVYFDKALTVAPNSLSALENKANALFFLGEYNKSITYFDKALAVNHNTENALLGKGVALVKLGKYNESIPYLDKALSFNPKDVNALNFKKFALKSLNKTNVTNKSSSNGNFLSYKNSIHGIAVAYPSKWVKKESQNRSSNDIVTFISPSGSELVNIRGGQPAVNISLEQWSGVAIDLLRKSYANFTLAVSNSTTLSGLPAHEVVFSGTIPSSGREIKVLEVLTIKDGSRFWIAAVVNPNDFSTFQPILHKMINSFSFSPGRAVQPSTSGTVNASRTNSSLHP